MHYKYNAPCGGLHEICSTAHSFDLRCESVTFIVVLLWLIVMLKALYLLYVTTYLHVQLVTNKFS